MAQIYGVPKSIKKPSFNWKDIKGSQEAEEKYIEEIEAFVKKRKPKGKNVGEIIRFQVADGYALYMIASMRPLELVHIDTGDGYQFQYAHLLTAKEVNEQLERQNALARIFGKRKTV